MDRMKIPEFERKMYRDIYSHEGGSQMDGTTKSGITEDILDELRNHPDYGKPGELNAIGVTAGKKPVNLTMKQRIGVYRIYQDRIYGEAARANGLKTGADLLNAMGDPKVAGAIADTTFREGIDGGAVAVQKAVNAFHRKARSGKSVTVDGIYGSNTFKAVREIVRSPQNRDRFLNHLANERLTLRVKNLDPGQTKPP